MPADVERVWADRPLVGGKQAGTGKEKEPHIAGEVLGPSEDTPMSVLAQPVSRQ